MPILNFEPTYASCSIHFAEWAEHAEIDDRGRSGVTWACALPVNERVHLSTGGDLKRRSLGKEEDIAGSIWVSAEPLEANGRRTTGRLSYHPASDAEEGIPATEACYQVSLSVSPAILARLAALAEQKQLPSISVHLPDDAGMTYAGALDGSRKDWDTKNHRYIEIIAVDFYFPIIDDDPLLAPPKPEPLALVQPLLARVHQRQGWILLTLLALCLLTWLRK